MLFNNGYWITCVIGLKINTENIGLKINTENLINTLPLPFPLQVSCHNASQYLNDEQLSIQYNRRMPVLSCLAFLSLQSK